ncbi:MAG: MFS transporter [Thermoplasmatales archaeon]
MVQAGKKDVPINGNVANSSNRPESVHFPWAVFVALAMGMLVYGVAESYGPVSAIGGVIPPKYAFLGLSLPYIAGGVGALMSGALADKIGRKGSFMITTGMILVGIIIYYLRPASLIPLIVSFILIGMAAIGLETPVLSMISEAVPARLRGRSLVIVQNFGNIGVAVTFIPLFLHVSAGIAQTAIALLFIAPLIALVVAWAFVSESAPWRAVSGLANMDVEDAWQIQDGNADVVKPSIGIPTRFLILIIIGIAQDVAFVYFSYGVGYSYFQYGLASTIPVIGGLTMAIVGVLFGLAFAERVSRKKFTMFSYGILVGFWAVLMGFEIVTGYTTGLLLTAIMTILFIPGELTWAARGMLEPELFPTKRRGVYMSIVRFSVWVGAGIIIALLTFRTMPFIITSSIVMLIFILSLSMTALWYVRGFETRSMSLAGLDKATTSKGDGTPGK